MLRLKRAVGLSVIKFVIGFGVLLFSTLSAFSVAHAQKMTFGTQGINFGLAGGLGQRWTHGATKNAGINFNSTISDVKISWGNAFAFSAGVDLTERWWLGLSYGYAFNDVAWSATNATSRNRFNGKLATESLLLLVNYKLPLGQIKSVGRFSVKAKLGGGVAVSNLSRISEYLQNSAVKAATIEDGRMIRPMALGSLAFVYHPSKKISVSAGVDLNLSGVFNRAD
jgi:hypothetical protein